ncbi:MAG: hypothetical protein FWC53_02465 [Firmicutes bacterium]|nr:hypothetical protein [Bacillota bacterium]
MKSDRSYEIEQILKFLNIYYVSEQRDNTICYRSRRNMAMEDVATDTTHGIAKTLDEQQLTFNCHHINNKGKIEAGYEIIIPLNRSIPVSSYKIGPRCNRENTASSC